MKGRWASPPCRSVRRKSCSRQSARFRVRHFRWNGRSVNAIRSDSPRDGDQTGRRASWPSGQTARGRIRRASGGRDAACLSKNWRGAGAVSRPGCQHLRRIRLMERPGRSCSGGADGGRSAPHSRRPATELVRSGQPVQEPGAPERSWRAFVGMFRATPKSPASRNHGFFRECYVNREYNATDKTCSMARFCEPYIPP